MIEPDPLVISRLEKASGRLFMAVSNALRLAEAFHVLNAPGERRNLLARSPASTAIFLYENASIREQVVIATRVFDRPGRDRLSFPVVRELLEKPGVTEHFVADARATWPALSPDENEATVRERIRALGTRLDVLASEEPNRLKRLRDFRDTNIAHELWHEVPESAPQFQNLWDIISEAKACAEDVKLIVDGSAVGWLDGAVERSAEWLWDTVAAASGGTR